MKIAIITGASSGLGREFALRLDRSEAFDEIWLAARSENDLQHTASMLHANVRILPLDLCDPESIEKIKALLRTERPQVKVLVNAAGFGKFGASDIIREQDVKDMIAVNVTATTLLSLAVLPFMPSGGRIINMASVSGFVPLPYLNVYAATKAFVLRFSQALHNELRTRGVSVTAVCPYWVDTNFIPVASDSPGGESVNNFPLITKASPVVERALRDNSRGRMHSFFGLASNSIHVLSYLIPACAEMAFWNFIRRKKK